MFQPKIITLLATFTSEDWRECGHYLRGRYREGNEILTLYSALKHQKLRLTRPVFEMEEIRIDHFNKITKKSFNNLLSKLYGKIEEYFIHHTLQQDVIKSKLTLLKALSDRGLYKEFDKKAEELEQVLLDENRVDLYDELHLMQLNHMRFFSNNPIKNHRGSQLLSDLSSSSEHFLRQYNQLVEATNIHFQQVTKENDPIAQSKTTKPQTDQIIRELYNLKNNPTDVTFRKLKDTITSASSNINKELETIILEFLIHNAHQRIKSGDLSIVSNLLELYEYGFDSGTLLSNQTMTENKLINVVVVACANENFEKAYDLLYKYSDLLLKGTRTQTILIATALIKFYSGEYANLYASIKDVSFKTTPQQIRRRWMLLCAAYKLMGTDKFYMNGLLKNYNSYLYNNRSKLSSSGFEGSMNLSRAIYMMLQGDNKEEIADFVNSCKHLIFKTWILKEVEASSASTS